jgi:predicted transcriptional regulator
MTKINKPTDSELDILTILWDKETATVKEVHGVIQQRKKVGYTTTLKLMQIMNEKGLVTRNSSSKKHVYTPALSKEFIQEQFLEKIIENLYGGSATKLILNTLMKHPPLHKDLAAIKLLIDQLQLR